MRQSISVAGIDDSRLTKASDWEKIIVAKQMFSPAPPDMYPPFVAGFVFLFLVSLVVPVRIMTQISCVNVALETHLKSASTTGCWVFGCWTGPHKVV